MSVKISDLLQEAYSRLARLGDSFRLEAELLLAHALDKPRSHLHAWPERTPHSATVKCFAEFLERRLSGEPLAYILGHREFWSLDLVVTPETLIPRPETELLVELALTRTPRAERRRIADLGTGSGAVALALAHERPHARLVATDISRAALEVAAGNARRLGITNLEFRQGDWCQALATERFDLERFDLERFDLERFDLILSNPPYLSADDPHLSQGDLRFEPPGALIAGTDALAALRTIITETRHHLRPGGWLLLEHGWDQGAKVCELLKTHGFEAITSHLDEAGWSRIGCGRRPAR